MSDEWEEPEQCEECGEYFMPEDDLEDGEYAVCDDCKG